MAPGRICVNIFGSEYHLISDDDEKYVKKVAQFVDDKMREIDKVQSINSPTRVAVMTALTVADELMQEQEYRNKLSEQLNEEAKKINQQIEEYLEE